MTTVLPKFLEDVTPEQAVEQFNEGLLTYQEVMKVFNHHLGRVTPGGWERYLAQGRSTLSYSIHLEIAYFGRPKKLEKLILGE